MKKDLLFIPILCIATIFHGLSMQARAASRRPTPYQILTRGGASVTLHYPVDKDGNSLDDQRLYWWRDLPWKKDDQIYSRARNEIDLAVKRGVKPQTLSRRYQAQRKSNPWNGPIVFKWAYSSWLAQKAAKSREHAYQIFMPVHAAIPEVKFAESYQYARMAFLAVAYRAPRPCAKALGERLLRRDPKDEDVKFYMIRMLLTRQKSSDDARALSYLAYFRKKYPGNLTYHREYAHSLQYLWARQYPRDRKKALAAVGALKQYLQKVKDAKERERVLLRIKDIEYQQKRWDGRMRANSMLRPTASTSQSRR